MTATWRDVEMAYAQGSLNFQPGSSGLGFEMPKSVTEAVQNRGYSAVDDDLYIISWVVLAISSVLFAVGLYRYTDAKDDEKEAMESLSQPVLVPNTSSVSA